MNAPYLADVDVTLYHGDVLAVLPELPAESVDCVVTSPPYWGLRDYGTGAWVGGDAECDHAKWRPWADGKKQPDSTTYSQYRDVCGKCGATRIDQQLGLEPTPEQYVERMMEVFREVRRVLAAHGTVWLNLGDSYASQGGPLTYDFNSIMGGKPEVQDYQTTRKAPPGLKPKDLVGAPWRVAFALQADGWYLRSDIIWSKPNPMPESVTDRPTKAHEYVFLLSKQPRYFFDQEAVREAHIYGGKRESNGAWAQDEAGRPGPDGAQHLYGHSGGRNIRSVWEIATQPYPEAHFATFPEELARRCIAAGTSEKGKCANCAAPWVREIERGESDYQRLKGERSWRDLQDEQSSRGADQRGRTGKHTLTATGTTPSLRAASRTDHGWRPSCQCSTDATRFPFDAEHVNWRAVVPCIVLDPFIGSGTVAYVARKLGRHSVGIDLNESYLELAAKRLQQQSLLAEAL